MTSTPAILVTKTVPFYEEKGFLKACLAYKITALCESKWWQPFKKFYLQGGVLNMANLFIFIGAPTVELLRLKRQIDAYCIFRTAECDRKLAD